MTYCRSQRQYRNKHGRVPVTRAPNLSYCWHLDLIVSCFRDALHMASEAVPLDLIHSMPIMSHPLHYWQMCVRVSADIAKCSSEIKLLQLQPVQKFYKSQPIPSCLQSWLVGWILVWQQGEDEEESQWCSVSISCWHLWFPASLGDSSLAASFLQSR